MQYSLKAKTVITTALSLDEFLRVSHCETAKEMWGILQINHEDTIEVKRARLVICSASARIYHSNKKIEPTETKCQAYRYLLLLCKSKVMVNNFWVVNGKEQANLEK